MEYSNESENEVNDELNNEVTPQEDVTTNEEETASEAVTQNENKQDDEIVETKPAVDKDKTIVIETINPDIEQKLEETAKNEEPEVEQEESEKKDDKTYRPVKEDKPKKKRKWGLIIGIILVLVLLLSFVSTIFAIINMKNVELVGLSKEDVRLEIEEAIKNEFSKDVILKYEDYETEINPEQIEAQYDIDKVVEEVCNYGKDGNIIQNNYAILFALLNGKEFEMDFSYNEKSLTDMITDISKKLPGAMKDNSYYIDGSNLVITKGKAGITIKVDEMKKDIIEQIKNPTKKYLEIKIENSVPEKISVDKIYQEVKKEPQNAYVSQDPFEVHVSENGIDFAISLEEARNILQEEKEEYEIPLKFITPEIQTSDLGSEAFPYLITQFSTRYNAGLINRSINLKLASDKINGTVILPGEEFSYNRVVGERTYAAGYKDAAIYSGGEVVDGLGGGICQISSTLYDLAVQANMEITERSNHQFVTSYIEAGKDATVVYGYIDFKFVNTRKYPVRIESSVSGGVAEMKMYGVKEEEEYDIKLETEVKSTIPYSVKYEEDSSLDAGVEVVRQNGAAGYKTITYKVYKQNGNEVKREVLSSDTYDAMTKIVRRGTRNVQTVKSTSPDQTKTEITTPSKSTTEETIVTTEVTSTPKPATTPVMETKPESKTNTIVTNIVTENTTEKTNTTKTE